MTQNQVKKIKATHNDVIEVSKTLVTQTRTYATTMREAMWAPWVGAIEENEVARSMVTPWLNMTRIMHDQWLEAYESNSHKIIEQSKEMYNRF